MHEYFVFLSQIVQAEGNFFLHKDIIRAKTEQTKLEGHEKSESESKALFARATQTKRTKGLPRAHYNNVCI